MQEKISNKKISIFFALQDIPIPTNENQYVLFYPASDNWNDFGKRTLFIFVIFKNGKIKYTGDTHLAFLGLEDNEQTNIVKFLTIMISNEINKFIDANKLPRFFTMFPRMQNYRDFYKDFKKEDLRDLLFSMNEIVALKHFGPIPKWLDEALNTKEFKLSFMRNSETFFVFYNAGSILDGLQFEELSGVSNNLNLRFQLDGFENEHYIEFTFDSEGLFSRRVAVVIGKNGVGKSQSLSHLVRAVISQDNYALTDADGRRPHLSRLVAIGTPGEGRVTFPREQKGNLDVFYKRLLLNRSSGQSGWRGMGEMLVQLVRSGEQIRGKGRWELFCEALNEVVPVCEIVLPLRDGTNLSRWRKKTVGDGSSIFVGIEKFDRGGEQACLETWGAIHPKKDPMRLVGNSVHPLSSGQLAFIRFAAQACLYIENGTLLLLDEPEIHLHPNLISCFMKLINHLLEETGSVAIIATHSVYFVREVPRSQVIVLRQNDKFIEIVKPRLKTLGADVGSISFFVFDDKMENSNLDKYIEKGIAEGKTMERLFGEVAEELSPEATMELQRRLSREAKI